MGLFPFPESKEVVVFVDYADSSVFGVDVPAEGIDYTIDGTPYTLGADGLITMLMGETLTITYNGVDIVRTYLEDIGIDEITLDLKSIDSILEFLYDDLTTEPIDLENVNLYWYNLTSLEYQLMTNGITDALGSIVFNELIMGDYKLGIVPLVDEELTDVITLGQQDISIIETYQFAKPKLEYYFIYNGETVFGFDTGIEGMLTTIWIGASTQGNPMTNSEGYLFFYIEKDVAYTLSYQWQSVDVIYTNDIINPTTPETIYLDAFTLESTCKWDTTGTPLAPNTLVDLLYFDGLDWIKIADVMTDEFGVAVFNGITFNYDWAIDSEANLVSLSYTTSTPIITESLLSLRLTGISPVQKDGNGNGSFFGMNHPQFFIKYKR